MPLNPRLVKIAKNLPREAKRLGFEAKVTSGFRTRKKQQELWENWQAGASPYPAARPGTSDHERGLAIDVVSNNEKMLVALLTEAGLYWAGDSDPIHFTMLPPLSKQRVPIRVARGESKKYKVPDEREWGMLTGQGDYAAFGKKDVTWQKIMKPILKAITLGILKLPVAPGEDGGGSSR